MNRTGYLQMLPLMIVESHDEFSEKDFPDDERVRLLSESKWVNDLQFRTDSHEKQFD